MKQSIDPVAELVHVTKMYDGPHGGTLALKDISFAAQPGEMILLLGPSGSGKTTFLTLLAGLQPPTSGDVMLFGRRMNDYSPKKLQSIRAKRMGFIFQTFFLLDSLTVLQNVMLVKQFAGGSKEESKTAALKYLNRFGIGHLADSLPGHISHGERQRVAVARSLVNGADLIFADEPTGSLASQQGMEIIDFLKESAVYENRCVVMTSHDERIIEHADRVLRLRDGEVF